MATSKVTVHFPCPVERVWQTVTDLTRTAWRSDLAQVEILDETHFVEHTKSGYATHFTVTKTEPYRRWEFDLENSRIRGHWTGLFTAQGTRTQIEFTECVTAKNPLMKLVLKPYLKKQQAQFVQDLKRALEAQRR